ncbi:MAG: hypothetical protein OXE50_15265 [Chloroflexi bacterium]|nr:hypothetical protein [Chloroflexota bacterium]
MVRANAAWRGVSISRYVVALVLDGGGDAPDGPALALAGDEKREMLETVRVFRAAMGDGAEAPPLIEDMRVRVRLLFDAWAVGMVRDGRRGEVRDILAARVGAAQAERVVENIVALADAPAQPQAPEPEKRTGPDASSEQGSLF